MQRLRWDDWRGGDRGHLSAYEAGRRQPERFGARNLMFDSRSGGLVYRAGVDYFLGVGSTAGSTCVGIGWSGYGSGVVWFVLRNNTTGSATLYVAPVATASVTTVGVVGVLPDLKVVEGVYDEAGRTYLTFPGLGLYYLAHSSNTVSAVSASLGGYALARYGDRLYVGGDVGGVFARVRFSDALDLGTFPALNYFDVGPGPQVRFLGAQRGHLAIALEDNSWWVLNGLPNAGGVLRRVTNGNTSPWQFSAHMAAVQRDDRIVHTPIPKDYPAYFDGAQVTYEDERSTDDLVLFGATPGLTSYYAVRALPGHAEAAIRSGHDPAKLLLNHRGAWTRHTFGFGGNVPLMASDNQSWLYFAGLTGSDFAIYRWNYDEVAPGDDEVGLATKPPTDATGPSTFAAPHAAYLHLPEWWHPEGADVTVRSVSVEVVGWGTARPAPTISARVKTLGQVEAGERTSATIARSPAEFDGIRTLTFHFGEQGAGRGFQVLLTDVTFLSILRVTVDLATDPPRQGR